MSTQLDPIVSEFETREQADDHDRWFRAKVQHSLDNPGRGMSHDEVMARADTLIEEHRKHRHSKDSSDDSGRSLV